MKTKDEIEEKASEYVEDVKDRIDSYAYLDVQEAFAEGAKWMQEQVNGDSTSYETALNIDVVSGSASEEDKFLIDGSGLFFFRTRLDDKKKLEIAKWYKNLYDEHREFVDIIRSEVIDETDFFSQGD